MNSTDQRLTSLVERARRSAGLHDPVPPFGFATRVLAMVPAQLNGERYDLAQFWYRSTLTALPLAAVVAATCWWWPLSDAWSDPADLVTTYFEAQLLP